MIVDAHVHLFPERVFHAIWRWFDRHAWNIQYRLRAEEVVQFLAQRGVARVVGLCYSHQPGMARALNSFMAELGRAHPEVIPLGTVLPGEPDAEAIVREAFSAGLRGLKLHSHVQKIAVDDPRLDPIYRLCGARANPRRERARTVHVDDSASGSSCVETARAQVRAIPRRCARGATSYSRVMHNACPDSQQITDERTALCTRSSARNQPKRDLFAFDSNWYRQCKVSQSVNGRRSKWTAGRMRRPRRAAMSGRPDEKPRRGASTTKGNTDVDVDGFPARSESPEVGAR